MLKFIETWKRGAFILIALILLGVLAPLMSAALALSVIIVPMYIMGFSLDFWDQNSQNIAFLAISILGPYFIGEKWEDIRTLSGKIKS